jgi:hypothetical protein
MVLTFEKITSRLEENKKRKPLSVLDFRLCPRGGSNSGPAD